MPPATLTHATALPLLEANDYEPLEPYPGAISIPWTVRCTTCGATRRIRYSNLRANPQRRRCKHGIDKRKVTTAEAEAFLKLCGYEPLEPYPGAVSKPWIVRCVICKELRLMRLKDLRSRPQQRTCKHSRLDRPWLRAPA